MEERKQADETSEKESDGKWDLRWEGIWVWVPYLSFEDPNLKQSKAKWERESEWEPNAKQSNQAHYCVYIYSEILTFKFSKEKVRNWWESWSSLRVSSNIKFVFVLIVWVIFVINTIIHFYMHFNLACQIVGCEEKIMNLTVRDNKL